MQTRVRQVEGKRMWRASERARERTLPAAVSARAPWEPPRAGIRTNSTASPSAAGRALTWMRCGVMQRWPMEGLPILIDAPRVTWSAMRATRSPPPRARRRSPRGRHHQSVVGFADRSNSKSKSNPVRSRRGTAGGGMGWGGGRRTGEGGGGGFGGSSRAGGNLPRADLLSIPCRRGSSAVTLVERTDRVCRQSRRSKGLPPRHSLARQRQ